jgi:DNA polymerase-3 subunit delta'
VKLQPWLMPAWHSLVARLERNELPHALLIAGAQGLGKRALADALASAVLCESRTDEGFACGRCRACLLVAAGSHPDRARVTFELRDDGKPRTEITIDQIRQLSQRLSLASQFGGLQVALIDPADAMNASAANGLLKTLEEPSPSTIIVLISDRPARLPATIRSRCQRIEVPLPTNSDARDWLIQQGISSTQADDALAANLGNPGQALAAINDDTLSLRAACIKDLAALRAGRASALVVADGWTADRPADRLWQASVIVRDDALRVARGEPSLLGLTGVDEIPKLASWFTLANQSRELLNTQVRSELVMLDLLHTWQTTRRN